MENNYTHVELLRCYFEHLNDKDKRRNVKPRMIKRGSIYRIKEMNDKVITIKTEFGLMTIKNDSYVRLIENEECYCYSI
jgi:hypothetical protein